VSAFSAATIALAHFRLQVGSLRESPPAWNDVKNACAGRSASTVRIERTPRKKNAMAAAAGCGMDFR